MQAATRSTFGEGRCSLQAGDRRHAGDSRTDERKNGQESGRVEGGEVEETSRVSKFQIGTKILTECRRVEKSRPRPQATQAGLLEKHTTRRKTKHSSKSVRR